MRSLDLDAVRAFVLVADLRSFTRAAAALDTTQSAVSLKLKRLEDRLGRRLVERTPRLVRPSADGAAFLDAARDLLRAHDRAVGAFADERQRLAVGVSQHLVGAELPDVLRRVADHDPALVVELRVAGTRELLSAFDDGALDAAIVLQPDDPRRKGEALLDEPFGWFASPAWEHRAGAPLRLATQGERCGVRGMAVRALDDAGIPWTEAFVGQGAAAVGAAATAGLAVAVLARRAAPAGTVDVGPRLSLPRLPTQRVMLYATVTDQRSRAALRALAAAFRSTVRR